MVKRSPPARLTAVASEAHALRGDRGGLNFTASSSTAAPAGSSSGDGPSAGHGGAQALDAQAR